MPRGHASHYRLLLEKLVSLPHLSMDPKARLRMAGRAKTEFLFKWRLRFTASPKAAPIFCVFGVVLLLYWGMQNLVIAVRSVRWTHPSQWDPSVAQHASLMGRECGELGCFLLVATFHERPAHWEKAHDTTKTKATQLIRNLPWIIYTRDLWQWMVKSIWKYCRISRFPRFPEQSWHFLTMAINQSQSDCDKLCIWIKWKQSPLQQLLDVLCDMVSFQAECAVTATGGPPSRASSGRAIDRRMRTKKFCSLRFRDFRISIPKNTGNAFGMERTLPTQLERHRCRNMDHSRISQVYIRHINVLLYIYIYTDMF